MFVKQGMKIKFCLQHDVWTAKGNRHAFIGALITFINANWKFVTRHLALKVVAWNHQGKFLAEPLVNLLCKHELVQKICLPCSISKQRRIKLILTSLETPHA